MSDNVKTHVKLCITLATTYIIKVCIWRVFCSEVSTWFLLFTSRNHFKFNAAVHDVFSYYAHCTFPTMIFCYEVPGYMVSADYNSEA